MRALWYACSRSSVPIGGGTSDLGFLLAFLPFLPFLQEFGPKREGHRPTTIAAQTLRHNDAAAGDGCTCSVTKAVLCTSKHSRTRSPHSYTPGRTWVEQRSTLRRRTWSPPGPPRAGRRVGVPRPQG